jgi:hypothetical protein
MKSATFIIWKIIASRKDNSPIKIGKYHPKESKEESQGKE